MTEENINTSNKIIIPSRVGGAKKEELLENLKGISDEDIQRIGKEMEKEKKIRMQREEKEKIEKKEKERIEKLMGNTDVILNDLKENYVKIEENVKMMGYKGKKVHIDLPKVGNFGGFKFDYFVSDAEFLKGKLEKEPKLEKNLYSINDISKLLQAMNEYMSELQGKNDGNIDYENELVLICRGICNAGDCLKAITGLNTSYWLSDKKHVAGERYERAELIFGNPRCYVYRSFSDSNYAKLLLKLSD